VSEEANIDTESTGSRAIRYQSPEAAKGKDFPLRGASALVVLVAGVLLTQVLPPGVSGGLASALAIGIAGMVGFAKKGFP
jgi:hypothetical protein